MLSWMLHGDAKAAVPGLLAFAPADCSPVQIVFHLYHLIVAVGMGFIALSIAGAYFAARRRATPPA